MCWSYFRHWCSFPSQSRARHSSFAHLCSRSRAGYEYAWLCCTRSVTSHPTDRPVPCLTWQGKRRELKRIMNGSTNTLGVRNSLISSSSTFTYVSSSQRPWPVHCWSGLSRPLRPLSVRSERVSFECCGSSFPPYVNNVWTHAKQYVISQRTNTVLSENCFVLAHKNLSSSKLACFSLCMDEFDFVLARYKKFPYVGESIEMRLRQKEKARLDEGSAGNWECQGNIMPWFWMNEFHVTHWL